MDISLPTMLSITPIYIAILGLMLVPMTLYVGAYRVKNKVDLGDNGDKDLIRRIRSHANFIESVPLAVVLLICVELMGAGNMWLHGLGATLVIGRALHFLAMAKIGPFIGRPIGMFATMGVYLVSSIWILVAVFL
jgi:uncharacterized membrane protein YecN with MAPEG domain